MGKPILYQWVVYNDPSDYPGQYVVRRFAIVRNDDGTAASIREDPEPLIVTDDLDEARAAIPRGAYCLRRHPDDDPVIYEVWT